MSVPAGASQSSREARSPDDRSGYRIQLVAQPEPRLPGADAGGQHDGRHGRQKPGVGVDEDQVAIDLDPGHDGSLEVASQIAYV